MQRVPYGALVAHRPAPPPRALTPDPLPSQRASRACRRAFAASMCAPVRIEPAEPAASEPARLTASASPCAARPRRPPRPRPHHRERLLRDRRRPSALRRPYAPRLEPNRPPSSPQAPAHAMVAVRRAHLDPLLRPGDLQCAPRLEPHRPARPHALCSRSALCLRRLRRAVCLPHMRKLRLQLRPHEEPVRTRARLTPLPVPDHAPVASTLTACLSRPRRRPKRNIRTAMNNEIMLYAIAQKEQLGFDKAVEECSARTQIELDTRTQPINLHADALSVPHSQSTACRATASPRTCLPPLEPNPAAPSLSDPFACADADPPSANAAVHGACAGAEAHV